MTTPKIDPIVLEYLQGIMPSQSLEFVENEVLEESLDVSARLARRFNGDNPFLDKQAMQTSIYNIFRVERLRQIFYYISEHSTQNQLTREQARQEVARMNFIQTPDEKEIRRQKYTDHLYKKLSAESKDSKPYFQDLSDKTKTTSFHISN